jgi:hypothetical protein
MAGADVHLLNIGTGAYGDCVVLQFNSNRTSRHVLIDGGHSDDKELLLEQFADILGGAEPFKFDLVMISHAHGDHVGALPELITDGHIVAEHALIPDVAMAFGATSTDALPDAITNAIALMREEPPEDEDAGLTGLDALAVDAATLLPRYKKMIARLTKDGTNVVHFGGRDSQPALADLSEMLGDIGFEVLGPQQKTLDRTAKLLSGTKQDLIGKAEQLRPDGLDAAELDSADVYADLATDAVGRLGHLVNAQSIVCVFTLPTRSRTKRRILLGGDFQFHDPQTSDPIIKAERARLLNEIHARSPYAFAKLSHHGSTNAVDDKFLAAIGDTDVVGICCGRGHPNHPAKDTLDLLAGRSATTSWVRTDRSGHVTVTITTDDTSIKPRNAKDLSDLNQPDAAPAQAAVAPQATSTPAIVAPQSLPVASPPSPPREQISAITVVHERDAVQCEIPARATSMTIHFDLATADGAGRADQAGAHTPTSPGAGATSVGPAGGGGSGFQIGGGRKLPKLLFLTDTNRLADNLDDTAVGIIVDAINDGGQVMCDLAALSYNTETGEGIADAVGGSLKKDPDVKQVVIIGSYDVVPSQQVDCVAKETPADVAADLRANESDGFVVWSDDPYVDIDQAGLADIPISRIPDGHNGKFTLKQLNAEPVPGERRHGIRNSAREFVEQIYNTLPGQNPFLVSTPLMSSDVRPEQLQTSLVYYMLHGMAKSATSFWGETAEQQFVEAVNIALIPKSGVDIAVLGCCWGALPASSTAYDWKPGQPIAGRLQNQSIALTLLAAGARAVIGCTGAHYSPTAPPYDGGAGPLHVALWKHLLAGIPPAEALFKAKYDFATNIARLTSPDELAIANKSLNQFTCLGLGC